jgi:hypothetical protein
MKCPLPLFLGPRQLVAGRDITDHSRSLRADYHVRMTTHTRFDFIGVAVVLAYLLNALFAIVLAALLLFLLTYMG